MFISNESVSDEYMVDWGERLGCGMNGSVRSAKSRSTGDDYAVKVIRDRPRARAEVEMHSTVMGHENVVQLHEVFCNELKFPGESDATAKLILIMEKMKGGELFQRIADHHHFTEREAVKATKQIVQAVYHLHVVHNVAHRDLKPENLLYVDKTEDAVLKVCDFGFAKIDNNDLATPQFTPYYASPQVLEAQKRYKRDKAYTYSKSCDIWSLGVIIYIMLGGYPPFYPAQAARKGIDKVMKKRIANAEFEFPDREWEMVSENAKNLIKGLLVVDPLERLTIEEVMQHPWLISDAPDIPLFSPHFIKSKDALATALAAGNRRLRTVELAPVETAYNPILIRAKQRQKSTTFTPAESVYQGDASNLEAPVDMSLQINILRTALCHLLNLLHMKSEDRVRSSDWEAWENLVRVTPALSHYARYDSKHITNQIALSLQKTIVAMKE